MKSRFKSRVVFGIAPLLVASALAISLPSSSFADSSVAQCSSDLNSYLASRTSYLALPKPTASDYKILSALFVNAKNERAACLKEINSSYNSQLQEIRAKYALLFKNSDKNLIASLKTQRDSELAEATLTRDNAMKNLPEIFTLPPAPTKTKKG